MPSSGKSVVCASPEKREVRDCCLYDLGVEVSPRPTKANAADMLRDGLRVMPLCGLIPPQLSCNQFFLDLKR